MLYEIETVTGKMAIAGLMYLRIKDIHGENLREGDVVNVKEYYNRNKEIVEELGGEYWDKNGNPGKDNMMGFELCTKDELKGELLLEYEGTVIYDEGMYSVKPTCIISHAERQTPPDEDDLIPLHDDMVDKYCHPLFYFEIIKRQEL